MKEDTLNNLESLLNTLIDQEKKNVGLNLVSGIVQLAQVLNEVLNKK